MKLIVAVDSNWGIGYKGELLARVRADLRNFASVTTSHTVILGSKTLQTFPGARPLKNRRNIVMSRREDYKADGAWVVHSVKELFEYVKENTEEEYFVIGGASIYNLLLPYCDCAYVTKFNKSFDADAFIPNLDESGEWECTERGKTQISDAVTDSEPGLEFCFCRYTRIKNIKTII